MREIEKKINPEAWEYLNQINKIYWCLLYNKTVGYTSKLIYNTSVVFNAYSNKIYQGTDRVVTLILQQREKLYIHL